MTDESSLRSEHYGNRYKKVRYFLFLSLGVERVYPPEHRRYVESTEMRLVEPDAAKACRRNIIALAGIVVLAGCMGADPRDLLVFGLRPSDDWGVLVLATAIVLAHSCWYISRYFHLRDGGEIEDHPRLPPKNVKLSKADGLPAIWTSADLLANKMALLMTCTSWCFLAWWLFAPFLRKLIST